MKRANHALQTWSAGGAAKNREDLFDLIRLPYDETAVSPAFEPTARFCVK
jgi:hypothetical protein